ncbi:MULTISPECIES: hypothetical protein [Aequorivita]|uniref:Uncharacterized protein n=2 Tax=Aequorivita TaxID=153265 RepID=A0AB35YQ02_9FLAO|nr:hypothetical protein [Aequorivita sp. Ant34-E75]WGF92015.1 hypothetical protein QCQ61_12465 [Aequorivita sp. Ant34-E75]
MKRCLTIIALLIVVIGYSQVGIGTVDPKSDLHIVKTADNDGGSIQIDGGIRLGGTESVQGSKGKVGQVLMSTGSTAEWVTIGKFDGYFSDCAVPNKVIYVNIDLPSGSNGNQVNVTSSQMTNALNSLPDGGIVVLRTNNITTYTDATTRLTIELPKAVNVLNKPFAIAFDGPNSTNNILNNNKSIEILVKTTDDPSYVYELSTVSSTRKFFIKSFPDNNNNDYKISEIENNSGRAQHILLFNSYTIKAINSNTWSFTTRDCYVQNPSN